jgi:hypothetical protein
VSQRGLVARSDVWDKISTVTQGEQPDITTTLVEDSGSGLKRYMERLERWDKGCWAPRHCEATQLQTAERRRSMKRKPQRLPSRLRVGSERMMMTMKPERTMPVRGRGMK